jgi:hypothetical protein
MTFDWHSFSPGVDHNCVGFIEYVLGRAGRALMPVELHTNGYNKTSDRCEPETGD